MNGTLIAERLGREGPKRLLAIDGGGIRGLLALGYLEAIESALAERHPGSDFRLADYFDLIGGTSAGALIGTLLALGWPVRQVREVYLEVAESVFRPARYWGLGRVGRMLHERFSARPLESILRRVLGERSLDSPDLRTGLMVVTKRVDTASVWPLVNFPRSVYFADKRLPNGQVVRGNRHFKLWELLRASTAAPSFFPAKRFDDVRSLQPAQFVDGAVSPHNNPALLLLMSATLKGFGLEWPTGPERILLCSVGTGLYSKTATVSKIDTFTNIHWARLLVPQLVGDCVELTETVLQWLSSSPTARTIDRTIGRVEPPLGGSNGMLHYLRYNVRLHPASLGELGIDLPPETVTSLQDMGDVHAIPHLLQLADKVRGCVLPEHFPHRFDPHEAAH